MKSNSSLPIGQFLREDDGPRFPVITCGERPEMSRFRLTCIAGVAALFASSFATAQTPPSPQPEAQASETVVVTARRRNEAIIDVPLAITVISSKSLEQLGITSTTDLANYVPGLEFNQFTQGNARNDRGPNRTLSFRGLALGGTVSAGASMYLNGAAVINNEVPSGMDIGAVEVLRGPQSVYFGRSTMTGAVAYRTKAIPNRFAGEAEVEGGQQHMRNIQASIAGPLVQDLLLGRLTVLTQDKDGYVSNDWNFGGGPKLGAQSREAVSTTLEFTPTPDLSLKSYISLLKDDDGPSATAFVQKPNCVLGVAVGAAPGQQAQPTFCGEIPGRGNSTNYVSMAIPLQTGSTLFSSPIIRDAGFRSKIGYQRDSRSADLVVSWSINDNLKLQSITGYHTQSTTAAMDGISQPPDPARPYTTFNYGFTFSTEQTDKSQELRLSSDPEKQLSWTVGATYLEAEALTSAIVARVIPSAATPVQLSPQPIGLQGTKTSGIFGGAYYKVTPTLTVSAEGRQQTDTRRASSTSVDGSGNRLATVVDLSAEFKSFSPRLSANWEYAKRQTVYASYATGTRPGGFNTGILAFQSNPVAYSQIQSLLGNDGITFKEEKLKVAEVGLKGELQAGRAFYDLNFYTGTLLNQQITLSAPIPALGFSVSGTSNVGESKIHGVEFQGRYGLTRELSLNGTFAWNYAERSKYLRTPSSLTQFGTTDFSGKKFAAVPEHSGSMVLAYNAPFKESWSIFATVSEVFRGKMYTDDFNASWIKQRFQTDLRAGVENKAFTFEGYIKNLFNDQGYIGGGVSPDFAFTAQGTQPAGTTPIAFFGASAPPRQFGLRMRARF